MMALMMVLTMAEMMAVMMAVMMVDLTVMMLELWALSKGQQWALQWWELQLALLLVYLSVHM